MAGLTLGNTIERIWRRQFRTKAEFAGALGVSPSNVSRYISGAQKPGRETLIQLLEHAEPLEAAAIFETLGIPVPEGGPFSDLSDHEQEFLEEMLAFLRAADERTLYGVRSLVRTYLRAAPKEIP